MAGTKEVRRRKRRRWRGEVWQTGTKGGRPGEQAGAAAKVAAW